MLKDNGFKLGVYDYFCKSVNDSRKGVFLITDKQSVFYSQVEGDYYTHDEIRIEIEKLIYPNKNINGFDEIDHNNIFIASLGHELLVEIPDGRLSYSKFLLFLNVLREMDRFNSKKLNIKKLELLILKRGGTIYKSEKPNMNDVISELKKLIVHDTNLEEEKIIGNTLDKDTIINCIKYQIDLESCVCFNDLDISLKRCEKYNNDNYYYPYFKEIFSDYESTKRIFDELENKYDEDTPITNITYDNILDKLNSFSSVKIH